MSEHASAASDKVLKPYSGYHQPKTREVDEELARVGPGTPCGDYLRRFWQPVLLSSELTARPKAIRIVGEDLVLFRSLGGKLGLLGLACSHRGTSLEYGIIAKDGIRCCYHGWLYGIDGKLLETPGEPPTSRLKDTVWHGAYPVHEYKGLIFAYMGPPEAMPEFPIFDVFEIPDDELVPYQIKSPVNWLQVSENAIDPFHTPFLHTRVSGTQFEDVWAELPVVEYHQRDFGFFYTNARRVGNKVWVRMHDHLLPNFAQNGGLYETASKIRYFGRPSLTRWVVPIDDTNAMFCAWRHFNDRDDPLGKRDRTQVGCEMVDFYGQTRHRPYELMQDKPGDYEAWVAQGPLTSHAREHLGSTDTGVAMLRRKLREEIRALKNGNEPVRPQRRNGMPIPTHGGDTIVQVPKSNADDRKLIREVSRKIAAAYVATQDLPDAERRAAIEKRISPLNVM
ncbi:MAG: Rieske 2Fe-2S domain-containing protein [Pseudomonadota bacterium]